MSTPKDVGRKVAEAGSASSFVPLNAGVTGLTGVRVFDVGQGDCIGLLDQNGEVCCYVDYGGALDHPDKGNPANTPKRLPAVDANGNDIPIVLTHWDKDHFYSAYKGNTQARRCAWIAPRQWAAPFSVRFAANLPNAQCWPESAGDTAYRFVAGTQVVEVRKCAAFRKSDRKQDRNTSGLAVAVIDETNGEDRAVIMLLPGDCHFDGIPNLPAAPLRAIVAYHHGSHVDWSAATAPVISSRAKRINMVYSYGASNTYGHPDRANYQPTWDAASVATPDVRANGDEYVDLSW
jgi:hypothetical protein